MADSRSHSDDAEIKRILEAIDAGADIESSDPVQPEYDVRATESGLTLNLSGVATENPAASESEVAPIVRPVTDDDLREFARVKAELEARAGNREIEPSTKKIAMLLDYLGTPQQMFKAIHVAGTNGKTSTVRMIASLLESFHRRVGYFVSPALESLTDMIAIDGAPIHPADFVRVYDDIAPCIALIDDAFDTPLSQFEVMTALAFAAFADTPVDVAVIEVGMGGAWDSTNMITADVDVLTPVGLDHTDFLGGTLSEIAAVKAGIVTNPDAVVVVGQQAPEAMEEILNRTVEVGAAVARLGSEFRVDQCAVAVGGQTVALRGLGGLYTEIFLPLAGAHQADNAAVALAAVEAFFGAHSGHQLDVDSVRGGFAGVEVPGRLERVSSAPTTFVDSSHNPAGAAALAAALERDFDFTRLVGVVGILADKDAAGILQALEPVLTEVVVTQPASPRALDAYELAETAREIFGEERVHVEDHLSAAVDLARDLLAEEEGELGKGIVITGSSTTAAQTRALGGKDA